MFLYHPPSLGTVHILCNHIRGWGGQGLLDANDYALRGGGTLGSDVTLNLVGVFVIV